MKTNTKGIVLVDSRKAPEEIKKFLRHLKKKGQKGKIAVHPKLPPQFFSLYATMDRDYYEGYEILLIDCAELDKAKEAKSE